MAAAVEVLPDIMIVVGLALLGYGLFLFAPWVSFSVVGGLLFVLGVLKGMSPSEIPTGENQ